MKLYNQLYNFDSSHSYNVDEAHFQLQNKFAKIAKTLFYGGYILVNGKYRVYIRTAEFYFHEENGIVKDEIVYHRNGKYDRAVPYFPLMSLHAHVSGYDITFENSDKEYRASALIRKYTVLDAETGMIVVKNDDRSTFLYDLLNGFSLGKDNNVRWIDDVFNIEMPISEPKPRRNVFKYVNGVKVKERDQRLWSFTASAEVLFKK